MWSTARSEAALEARLPVPIQIRKIRSARRMRLRLDEGRGVLKLTCPPRVSRRAALQWALEQRDWIAEQLAGRSPGLPLDPGAVIPIEGLALRLHWDPVSARTPIIDGGRLICGGSPESFPSRITRHLRRLALDRMSEDVAHYCCLAGLPAAPVSIGDAATRWGSCSSRGTIRMNWRLICAPAHVRRYVVAHEVAHLRHLDHGAAFRALEAELFGRGLAAARAELRELSPVLRRIGRR
jgi:predicted metal-dependent hydrolase